MESKENNSRHLEFVTDVLAALAGDRYEDALSLFLAGVKKAIREMKGSIDEQSFEREVSHPITALLRYKVGGDLNHLSLASSDEPVRPSCCFCGKNSEQVQQLIAGPDVFICNECVEICSRVLSGQTETKSD